MIESLAFVLQKNIYVKIIQFWLKIWCYLGAFLRVKFGFKDLICVKELTFGNSGKPHINKHAATNMKVLVTDWLINILTLVDSRDTIASLNRIQMDSTHRVSGVIASLAHCIIWKFAFSGRLHKWRNSLHLFSFQEWTIQRANKCGLQKHSFGAD